MWMSLLVLVWIQHIPAIRTNAMADANVKVIDNIIVYLYPVALLVLDPLTRRAHNKEYFIWPVLRAIVVQVISKDAQVLNVKARFEGKPSSILVCYGGVKYVDIIAVVSSFAEFATCCFFTLSGLARETALAWLRFVHQTLVTFLLNAGAKVFSKLTVSVDNCIVFIMDPEKHWKFIEH